MKLENLTLDELVHVMYYELIKRLDYEKDENARLKLDAALGVSSWQSPLSRKVPRLPVEGPWWWQGEEDASSSFLTSMGIQLD